MSGLYWTDTFNPVMGCTSVSLGCANCWAQQMHERFHATPFGEVRCLPEVLAKPLKRRKPTTYFVCNTSDLFHPAVPLEFIAAVYGVMAACPQHTFLVCTKRPERRAEFMRVLDALVATHKNTQPHLPIWRAIHCWSEASFHVNFSRVPHHVAGGMYWPLPNVWEGVSVETLQTAKQRLDPCPDWISAEPLLGPIDFDFASWGHESNGPQGWIPGKLPRQVIVGGESGPNARPCDVEWIRSIVEQCREAGVKCFVKQLGSQCFGPAYFAGDVFAGGVRRQVKGAGSAPSEWPEDLRVRELGWNCRAKAAVEA